MRKKIILFIVEFDFGWVDLIDVLIVTFFIYQIYNLVKGTVAIKIFVGILLVYVLWLLVKMLDMQLTGGILGKFIEVGMIALIVVFQQEIRRFLLMIGTTGFYRKGQVFKRFFFWGSDKAGNKLEVASILDACKYLSNSKTGAIIVIARNSDLSFYINTGEKLNGNPSAVLLECIFYKNNPLHDGAVIIQDNRIKAARCILPVTEQKDFPSNLGMRHRAAAGMTEQTDAVAIIISEQRGTISFAENGKIMANMGLDRLKELLETKL